MNLHKLRGIVKPSEVQCMRSQSQTPLKSNSGVKAVSPLTRHGFPGGSLVTDPPANAEDTGDKCSVPETRRSPGGGSGNPLQYSCLETWWLPFMGTQRGRYDRVTEHALTKLCWGHIPSHPLSPSSVSQGIFNNPQPWEMFSSVKSNPITKFWGVMCVWCS